MSPTNRAFLALALLAGIAPLPAAAAPGDLAVVADWPSPQGSPDGLAFDGESLWVSDCAASDVARVSPDDGGVIERFSMGFMVDQLDFGSGRLWMTDHGSFYRIDPETREIVERIAVPWSGAFGVADDGAGLWSQERSRRQLHHVGPDGAIRATLPDPAETGGGVASDGRCLWVSDLVQQKLYAIDPADGSVELTVEPPGGKNKAPTGIAFGPDGADRRVFVADQDPVNPRLYEVRIEGPADGPCAAPAIDPEDPEGNGGAGGAGGTPETPATRPDGGCSTAGGASFAATGLLAVLLVLCRRA
jgi:sugar lactone lactonase YvrE